MHRLQQLFDTTSCTYSYLLVDERSHEAVLIDPVDTHLDEYLSLLQQDGLQLQYVVETHAHADHITSAGKLCQHTGAKAATPAHCHISPAEIQLEDGQLLNFGENQQILAIHTPGHTAGSMSFYWQGNLFTGDALLINGCGRTDFQSGDAAILYHSIKHKLFSYPDDTAVYPAHDYHGNKVSSIGHEKQHNARIAGKSLDEFVNIMRELSLPKPALMDIAVQANLNLGLERHAA